MGGMREKDSAGVKESTARHKIMKVKTMVWVTFYGFIRKATVAGVRERDRETVKDCV